MIAILVRRLVFLKVGLGGIEPSKDGLPTVYEKGQFKVISELYSVSINRCALPEDDSVLLSSGQFKNH